MGPRAGRALDRPAHGRGGLRARRRRAHAATTPSCSTSSATSSSRSTSSRCCSRSAAPGRWPTSPSTAAKLIRRHPHVFGEVEVGATAPARSCATGTRSSRARTGREPGIFGEVPENLPGPLLRAQGAAPRRLDAASTSTHVPLRGACAAELDELRGRQARREERFHEVGDVLFAAVNVARKLKVDPELALRAAAERFRGRVEAAERARRGRRRATGTTSTPTPSSRYYARARLR